jgi:hypothetical protein
VGVGHVQIEREMLIEIATELQALSDKLLDLAGPEPESDLAPVAPGQEDISVILLARAIEGEGAALFGDSRDEVGLWIGHTAMNRMAKPWWSDTMVGVISKAFHGYINVQRPARWAVRLAKQAMERDEDITDGALFMLSGQDLDGHGWPSSGAHQVFVSDDHEMYFFRTWPGD